MSVLIAGFGPFPGARKNPSGDLARALGRRRRPALAGARIVSVVLPTTYAAVERELPALIAEHEPELLIFFGLAGGAARVRIETRAVNAASALHPDAARRKPGRRALVPGAPGELPVRAPAQRLAAAARAAGVSVCVSVNAGRYLCNAGLFFALDLARRNGRPRRVAFVHIPRPRSALPSRRRRKPRPTMRALERAGEAILVAFLAEARRG